MPKENYFIPQENLPKIAEVRYWEEDQKLLTPEEWAEQQKIEESYNDEFASYGDMGVAKSYGPGNNPSRSEDPGVNRKAFEIIGKGTFSGRVLKNGEEVNFIKFCLDDELNGKLDYTDGKYNHIYFVDRSPFNRYQKGDILKIDLNKIRCKGSGHNFNDTSVAVREYWSAERKKNSEDLVTKGAAGAFVAGVNAYCPKLGDMAEDTLRLVGIGMETAGTLTENENLKRVGGNVQSGAGIGSAVGEVQNGFRDMKGHAENCLRCEIPGKLGKSEKIARNVRTLASAAEVASFGVKSLNDFKSDDSE